ncbi:MAG: peptidylprolyl isomerase [Acidobacteriota bacterium]|nr:peptidylprolyl isomerase [Acidobacteriota bacterium]
MRRRVVSMLVPALLGLTALTAPSAQETDSSGVWALIELNQRVYYAGEPFNVRVSIGNGGEETIDNPVKTPLFKGFKVRPVGGDLIAPTGTPTESDPQRPAKLGGRGFYGGVVDLTTVYPELMSNGHFEIEWSEAGVESNTLSVKIIPRFDVSADYRAIVDTDQGKFVIDFFGDVSPIAVKNFVDLSRAKFYDGLIFHEVRRDHYIVGGDPTATGSGTAGYSYPAEMSATPAVAGTVLMKPVGPTPPANSSQFVILLRPEPAWVGQFTVVGQVVEGLDIIRKISQAPVAGAASGQRQAHRPRTDLHLKSITIEEKAP